jgi:DNA-binding transcriptional regulator GbsR (MarR family)
MSSISLSAQILMLLHERGSLSARDLQAATGMSQSSISLALTSLGDKVCRMGAARSTRYAATKDILGLAAKQSSHFLSSTQKQNSCNLANSRILVMAAYSPRHWSVINTG